LKNKWKVDPVQLLYVLYERKEHALAIKLASTIVDTYTLALLLNGKDVMCLWRKHSSSLRFQLTHLENICQHFKNIDHQSENQSKQPKEEVVEGFRQISIPL